MSILTKQTSDPDAEARRIAAAADAQVRLLEAKAGAQDRTRAARLAQARLERAARAEERRNRRLDRQQDRSDRSVRLRVWAETNAQRVVLVAPIILVNVLALGGQIGFARAHLGWGLPAAVVFACALESIAVYIGWHAHSALLAGDSAGKLRITSYLMGCVVGGLNYEHYAHGMAPTVRAVTFGLMSVISPWLWAMHGRHANRKRLRELGMIDSPSPHFSMARWIHFPLRTLGALRWAIANGVQDPDTAWSGAESARRRRPPLEPMRVLVVHPSLLIRRQESAGADEEPVTLADLTQADAIRHAVKETASHDPGEIVSWLSDHGLSVARQRVCDVMRRDGISGRHRLSALPSQRATG